MHNILKDIIAKKKEDMQRKKKEVGVTLVVTQGDHKGRPYNTFIDAVLSGHGCSIIGEIKLASPTETYLGSKEEILERVIAYEKAGVAAISCITEPHYFHGDIAFVSQIKEKVSLPVLQKDFVIDESQIYEAKQAGSDALLLISRLVDEATLKRFVFVCQEKKIEPVVEIHNEEDLEKAVATDTDIIAVNARDLETFKVDVANACALLKKIPEKFITLGFSGVHGKEEVEMYREAGVSGILVGTELMKAKDINGFFSALL